ncbi:NAD-dependent epimerase/dehydratase family protein [Allomuricauda sp. d1]|uniref:NAD-dependent epimerase/dehydratase family protein n=1 Tax=Allomuricauda sp. d1 TaxID=3136725 RepID=UPI0031D28C7C
MNKSIGILGCGWLGLPLAQKLLELGHHVSGTTTSAEKLERLRSHGISPFLVKLSEDGIEGDVNGFLSEIDVLVINVPPALRSNPNSDYVKKMELLNSEMKNHKIQHVLFVSSTSVYGNQEGEITEETKPEPETESGKQLLASEQLFFDQTDFSTAVVRFGGLIGPERHPVYHLAKKERLKNGDELVNLIHLDDCIHMIVAIIENNYWEEIFNGVYPYHPTKRAYYIKEAKKRNLPNIKYTTSEVKNGKKCIISKNFLNKNYMFYTSIVS